MRTVLFLVLLALFFWFGSATAAQFFRPLSPGNHVIILTHGDRERSAIVHVPPRAIEKPRLPVVLNFHGGGGNGANQQDYSLMDQLADRETFVAVYPNGSGRFQSRLLTWNAGTCCAYSAINNVDDVGFVIALLKRLEELIPIDRRRGYATGLSNGAMMAYRLAAEAADHFAAVAPVAGGMVVAEIKTSRPVPVMHFHSVDDMRALYNGGLGPPFPLTRSRVFHPNIDETIARWVDHNGCRTDSRSSRPLTGGVDGKQTATRYAYYACRDEAEVVVWKFTGVGHVWPGGKQNFLPKILGPSTTIVDANTEMWRFFSRFQLKSS